MPSYSIGFCVAMTRNGSGSGRGSPSTDTCPSCIASSSAAWVFGGVRLISSASSTFVNTGPGAERELLRTADRTAQRHRAREVGGQHVGRELHAAEHDAERAGGRVGEQRLGDAGNAFEQHVSATASAARSRSTTSPWPTTTLLTSAETRSRRSFTFSFLPHWRARARCRQRRRQPGVRTGAKSASTSVADHPSRAAAARSCSSDAVGGSPARCARRARAAACSGPSA